MKRKITKEAKFHKECLEWRKSKPKMIINITKASKVPEFRPIGSVVDQSTQQEFEYDTLATVPSAPGQIIDGILVYDSAPILVPMNSITGEYLHSSKISEEDNELLTELYRVQLREREYATD